MRRAIRRLHIEVLALLLALLVRDPAASLAAESPTPLLISSHDTPVLLKSIERQDAKTPR